MTKIRVDPVGLLHASDKAESAYAACLEIRRVVFSVGQGVPLALEFDGLDEDADHFIAWRLEEESSLPIGTARMRRLGHKAKAERVAVLDDDRERGAGRELMAAIEMRARSLGLEEIVLHAQISVIPFYEKLGYEAFGEVFSEAEIAHRKMHKSLI